MGSEMCIRDRSATDRATGLPSTLDGEYDAATAGLPAAEASHARGGCDGRVAHSCMLPSCLVASIPSVRARDKCCQARPIELLGCSAHVVVGVIQLQPACQQLKPPSHARGGCDGCVAHSCVLPSSLVASIPGVRARDKCCQGSATNRATGLLSTRGGGCDAATAGLPACLLYTSPSPRDGLLSRMPSSA